MKMRGIQIQVTEDQHDFIEKQRAEFGFSKSAYMRMLLGQAMNGTNQVTATTQARTEKVPMHIMKEPPPKAKMTAAEAVRAILHSGKKVRRIEFVKSLEKLLDEGNTLYTNQLTGLLKVYYSVFEQNVTITDEPKDKDPGDEWNERNGNFLRLWKNAINARTILFRALKFDIDSILKKEINKFLTEISLLADNEKISGRQYYRLLKIRKRLPGRLQLIGAPVNENDQEVRGMIEELLKNPEQVIILEQNRDFMRACASYPHQIGDDSDIWNKNDVERLVRYMLKRPCHLKQQDLSDGPTVENDAEKEQDKFDKYVDYQASLEEEATVSRLFH